MIQEVEKGVLCGEVLVPSSKSDAQRAILAAALAKGKSRICHIGFGDDVKAMLNCIKVIGAEVSLKEGYIDVIGANYFPAKASFDCGESGLTFRLLSAICCLHKGEYTLNGSGSILTRSHKFIDDFALKYGIKIKSNSSKLPYLISGGLDPSLVSIEADGSMTSQFISGLLMGIPLLGTGLLLHAKDLRSLPYVKMTLKTMKHFGIHVDVDRDIDFTISKDANYKPAIYAVEKDWSAASYWIAAGAIGHQVSLKGLSSSTVQADVGMLAVIQLIGGGALFKEDCLHVHSPEPGSFRFDATDCPDLFPALVCLALFCNGLSKIKGVHRLLNKESDRAKVLLSQFEKIGGEIYIDGDEMCIEGLRPLHFAEVSSHGDHRIAMCLAITALQIEGGLSIDGASAVSKSYPEFWEDLEKLRVKKNGAKAPFNS